MNSYFMLFTITPVQSFIEQARKTSDLYAGSRILSELVETAKRKLVNDYEAQIIFPKEGMYLGQTEGSTSYDVNSLNKTDKYSSPNRFMAMLKTANDPKYIGNALEDEVQNKFRNIANESCVRAIKNKLHPSLFEQQIDGFWQIYWVMLPYDSQNGDYVGTHRELEKYLGGIKNLRDFRQLAEPGGRKCSICGERNTLFYSPRVDNNGEKKKPKYIIDEAIPIEYSRLDEGEGLCAVCLCKRYWFGENHQEFSSTAQVSLMTLLFLLNNDLHGKNYLDNFRNTVNNCCRTVNNPQPYNDQLIYSSNLNKAYFRKNGLSHGLTKGEIDEKILNAHKQLTSYIKNKNEEQRKNTQIGNKQSEEWEIPAYYALIAFDGDSMGEWLSGKYLKDKQALFNFHQDLSKRLHIYAEQVCKTLIDPLNQASSILQLSNSDLFWGRVVYAGGEDFLGFITRKHALAALSTLRQQFDDTVNNPLKKYFNNSSNNISFSAGLVFAHYKMPLSEVLKWVRRTEKEAKDIDGDKDALAIAVLKHSGEIVKTIYKWRPDGNRWVTGEIQSIIDGLRNSNFSAKFITSLNNEVRRLSDHSGGLKDITDRKLVDGIIETEISRLVGRAFQSTDTKQESNNFDKENIINSVKYLYQTSKQDINNFLSALNIAHFLSREVNQNVD